MFICLSIFPGNLYKLFLYLSVHSLTLGHFGMVAAKVWQWPVPKEFTYPRKKLDTSWVTNYWNLSFSNDLTHSILTAQWFFRLFENLKLCFQLLRPVYKFSIRFKPWSTRRTDKKHLESFENDEFIKIKKLLGPFLAL